MNITHLSILLGAMIGVSHAQGFANFYDRKFDRADLNSDDLLDRVEWLATQPRSASKVDADHRFDWADADASGDIDRVEFRASRAGREGGRPSKLEKFEMADGDDDGELDPTEYADTEPSVRPWNATLRKFDRLDRDDSGGLSQREFGIITRPTPGGGATTPPAWGNWSAWANYWLGRRR